MNPGNQTDPEVHIAPLDETGRKLWAMIISIAEQLDGDWTLVGGLMVQLHAYRNSRRAHRATAGRDIIVRTTTDIDILANSRRTPSSTEEVAASLERLGFQQLPPTNLIEPDIAFVYERDDLQVDLLAPDGVRDTPRTSPGRRTVPIPGGTQALQRTIPIPVVMDDGSRATVPVPTLLGALLIKARSLLVHQDPDAQRQDLVALLSYVDDPLEMRDQMRKTEATWLRRIEKQLNLGDPLLGRIYAAEDIRRAQATYTLLVN